MLSQREEGAIAAVTGLAVIGFWLWFGHLALLIFGAVYGGIGLLVLAGTLRGGQTYHQYDTMVRWLWSATRQLPDGQELTDPATGATLTVEREGGRTILAVRPAEQDSATGTVTRYVVGAGNAPAGPPPLLSHIAPAAAPSPLRRRWVTWHLINLDVATGGATQVSSAEVAELWAQVIRALGLEYRRRSP